VYVLFLWVHDVDRAQFLKIKVTAFREPAVLLILKCITTTATSTSHLMYARTYVPTYVGLVGYAAVGGM